MNKEEFKKLKEEFEIFTTITPDNIMKKSIEIPKIHSKYLNIYMKEKKELKNINTNIDTLIGKLHHKYMHSGDFQYHLSSLKEVDRYIYGDKEYEKIKLKHDTQSLIVECIEERLQLLKKMGFYINNYIDFKKMQQGIMT